MKLLAKSPSGVWFAFDADLTGNIDMYAGNVQVNRIEIRLRGKGFGMIVSQRVLDWTEPLWVAPEDLCDESTGCPFNDEELIEMTGRMRLKNVGPV